MSVSEKEKPHTAAEMLQSFRGMIEGGTWSEVLAEMPEPLLRKHLETLCHAALLSQDSGQAVAFLLALSEKAKACKVLPEQYAMLTKTMQRANTKAEEGGWQAVQSDQTEPESVALPFPRGVFPPMLERYLDSAAENVQVDRAMIGAAMLAACALCLQGRCKISYPSGSGHSEQLCLYLVIVGSPGERKSSAFAKAVLPVYRWQNARREVYKQELAEYETACKIKEKESEALERQLGEKKITPEKRQQLGEDLTALKLEQEEKQPPISPEILATDTTAEALSNLMERTGETAGVFSDEADFLKILAGLYNRGNAGNLQLPLTAYDGAPFSRLRGKGTMFLSRPLLSICLYAQPTLYEEIRSNSELQGRGLVGRLLFCVPRQMAGKRNVRKCVRIDKAAETAYCDLLGGFLDTPQQPESTIPVILWEHDAAEEMLDYLQTVEDSMDDGNPMEQAKDYASKAGGVVLRIAGVLHMLWTQDATKPVSVETAWRAKELHMYFFSEKMEAMEQEETREERLESTILKKLADLTLAQGKAYTTVSSLQRKVKNIHGLRTAKELEPFLEAMQSGNQIEIDQQSKNKRLLYIFPYFQK
ncbi:YfjI family protein [Ruminococcus sp.]|uniref:YfjI family protein n=1 Tax=Ruminococcus sp. TaxID=41978 RepID=UPI002616D973|nr:YfjI family protein [Ruminococcus sp.]MEE0022220.1 YfjI family protein [Ruminococcus sp.]